MAAKQSASMNSAAISWADRSGHKLPPGISKPIHVAFGVGKNLPDVATEASAVKEYSL